jgi:hypothetical protein
MMEANLMAGRAPLALMLMAVMLSSGLAGCLGDEALELLPEKKGVPGGLTLACLRSSMYTSMVIEIDHEPGYRPYSSSADMLVERLESVCDKPSGITVKFSEVNFNHEGTWSAQDVRDKGWAEKDQSPREGTTLRWQIIFPAGTYETDTVLGVAVDASTVALFSDSIDEADGPFGRPSVEDVENSVLVHEVGHLLGLVNLVYKSPVDHEDPDHPGHSNNDESVMYWAVESSDISNFIFGDLPNEFDADDLADLAGLADGSIAIRDQLWS